MDPVILGSHSNDVTYNPRAGGSYTLTCVLDSGEQVQEAKRVYQTAWAPLGNFTGEPVKGDAVVIGSVTYRVSDIEKQHFDGRLLSLSVNA